MSSYSHPLTMVLKPIETIRDNMKVSSFLFRQGITSSLLTISLLLLSLLFVNWQINILGMEKYGLLVLLLSVFGTINMLNIGIGSAMVDYYTKYGEDKSVFWSIFIVAFFFILSVSIFLMVFSSLFYREVFNLLSVEKENLNLFAYYGFALIGVSRLLGSITTSYWVARVDFLMLKLFGFANIYLSITTLLTLYSLGLSFNSSLFYAGLINFLTVIAITIRIIASSINIENLSPFVTTKHHYKEFISSGFQFQLLSIINNLSNPIINTLINTHFGLYAVSLFDVALKLLRSGRQIIVSATEPFFGKITQLNNQNKILLMRLLVLKYTKYMMLISFVFVVITIFSSHFILKVWMGENIANSIYMTVNIISVGFSVNIISSIVYNKYLAIKIFRKYVLFHQLILLVLTTTPFILPLMSLHDYALYYSIAYIFSSGYLLVIFYTHRGNLN